MHREGSMRPDFSCSGTGGNKFSDSLNERRFRHESPRTKIQQGPGLPGLVRGKGLEPSRPQLVTSTSSLRVYHSATLAGAKGKSNLAGLAVILKMSSATETQTAKFSEKTADCRCRNGAQSASANCHISTMEAVGVRKKAFSSTSSLPVALAFTRT